MTLSSSLNMKLLSVSLLLLLILSSADADLIDQTCKKTPFYDLCRATLRSDPQISNSADIRSLAASMADTCLSKATDTLSHIKDLISRSSDQRLEQSLAYCDELYIPVVKYSLPQAIEALTNGHYAFAEDGLADAKKQADACDAKFSWTNDSPLRDMNDVVRNFADIATAITEMLLKM